MKIILRINYIEIIKFFFLFIMTFIILGGSVFIYFYFNYSLRIDRAVQTRPWEHFPTIYSAPCRLFPGMEVDIEALIEKLRKRGYVASTFLDHPPCYYVLPDGMSIIIANAKNWSAKRLPLKVIVKFSARHISSLYTASSKRALPFFYIRPDVLSAHFGGKSNIFIHYKEIPQNLIYAVCAAEDRRFFNHPGIDIYGIFRSFFHNLQSDSIKEGGSTITQQVARNIFLSPKRTFKRKLQEAFISLILESRLSKEKLFEMYSNIVYLGQCAHFSIYGFAEGASIYCNKNIRNLSLAECAMLAGMIRSPNRYQPFRHPFEALKRRNYVLKAMEQAGYILPEERSMASAESLPIPSRNFFNNLKAPYFMDYLSTIERKYYPKKASSIYTTLNMELQRDAELAVKESLIEIRTKLNLNHHYNVARKLQAAMVVIDAHSGHILAMVGGDNYLHFPFNHAVHGFRQAGSTIKPFVYGCILDASEKGKIQKLTPNSIVIDRPVSISYGRKKYIPHNYKNIYKGIVTMKEALVHSLNAATVLFAQKAGFYRIARCINRLGFSHKAKPFPSVALGTIDVSPLELATAYTVFTNNGQLIESSPFPGVNQSGVNTRIFSPIVSNTILHIMEDVVDEGTAKNIRRRGFSLKMAGKTGTAKDGWFVGITGNLICCCWMGCDDSTELTLSGGESAVYIFTYFLNHALKNYKIKPISKNQNLTYIVKKF